MVAGQGLPPHKVRGGAADAARTRDPIQRHLAAFDDRLAKIEGVHAALAQLVPGLRALLVALEGERPAIDWPPPPRQQNGTGAPTSGGMTFPPSEPYVGADLDAATSGFAGDLAREWTGFRDWCLSEGKMVANIPAAWRRWCSRSAQRQHQAGRAETDDERGVRLARELIKRNAGGKP